MKLNMITNAEVAAIAQPPRHWLSACTLGSGRVAVAEQFGAGLTVRTHPCATQGAGGLVTGFAAQLSTAPASGPCASKQYQQMAPIFATSGGELGSHPPRDRDPV